ncbi:MAG: transcription elongation factor GreA [Candidatus Levybacteria bacterium RIFCSPHIGHO2_02_FULL_37_10]|nr:MAG: transcription elongation factor GreA [Candidatus Levybacteria bacterium RIFCSPHIGHO2_02_FULL_37_10]OGH41541.1 MAG: transcription elongation factor GreA [Candidatus Levybacteria bacterium RIFCSPLOWO2_02_FULL_36_8b]
MDNNKKIYLTKEGFAELKKEYDELVNKKRPDVLGRVSQARNMGDLSENAEYVASREELTFVDGRIDELEIILKQAVVIRDAKTSNHAVKLGSTVTLHSNGKKEVFTVVGEWEADPENKKISHESPLGKVLLGKKVGEKVQVQAPAGKIIYSVISVK